MTTINFNIITLLIFSLFICGCNSFTNEKYSKDDQFINEFELIFALEGVAFQIDNEIWKSVKDKHHEAYKFSFKNNELYLNYSLALIEDYNIIIDTIIYHEILTIEKPELDSLIMMVNSIYREDEFYTNIYIPNSWLINLRVNSKKFNYYHKQFNLIDRNRYFASIVNNLVKLLPDDVLYFNKWKS